MINIYCLVDPRNNTPFYVGSTKRKLSLRLSGHISDSKGVFGLRPYKDNVLYVGYQKKLYIQSIINGGNKPQIVLLCSVAPHLTDLFEKYFYSYFKSQNIDLLQVSNRFNYQKQKIENYFKNK